MSAVVNERDLLLAAAPQRLTNVNLGTNIIVPVLKGINLTADDSPFFRVDASGVATPTSKTVTARLTQVAGTVTFSVINGTATLTGTGNSRSFTYASMTTNTITIRASVTENSVTYTSDLVIAKVFDGQNGGNSIVAVLSNETASVPADTAGTVLSFAGAFTTMSVYLGTTDDSANWTYSAAKTNVTCSEAATSRTQTVTAMSADAGYVDITATKAGSPTQVKRFNITKVKGAAGAAGQNATAYWLTTSDPAIAKSVGGAFTPASVTVSLMSATGTGAPAAYAGRFIIATTTDGINYTNQYTSAANESSKVYTVPVNTKAIRVRGYLAGGTTTLLDEQILTVVSDGPPGATGASGLMGILSNEADTVPADQGGAVTSFFGATTTMSVYNGATDDSANWTYSAVKTNVTCSEAATSRTQTVTALTADTGTVVITASRSGYSSISRTFTITKARAGLSGSDGTDGLDGQAFKLITSTNVIAKSAAGVYTPTSVTVSVVRGTGTSAPSGYAARFKIATTTDGSTYTDQYTSAADELSKTYAVPAGIRALRVRSYLAGGTTVLLDEQIIPVVSDGQAGSNGTNGAAGARGSIRFYTAGSVWSDTAANNIVTASTGSAVKIIGDEVTISNNSSFAETRVWDGSAWIPPGMVLNGNLFVDGTIVGTKIAARSMNADRLAVNAITAASAVLANASVTNATIGGDLWSDNWTGAGGTGWAILKAGSAAYFNNIYARGDIHASSVAANIIYTAAVQGAAISSGAGAAGTGTAAVAVYAPAGTSSIMITGVPQFSQRTISAGEDTFTSYAPCQCTLTYVRAEGGSGLLATGFGVIGYVWPNPTEGTYTFTITTGAMGFSSGAGYVGGSTIQVTVNKR